MRWPFGRSSRPADGSATPARGAADRIAADRAHDPWRSLPPIRRAIGDPPTVAPVRPFAASLATRQAPDLALAALGHEVSPLGSAGIVVGHAAPAGAVHSGRLELPVQRYSVEGPANVPETAGWSSFEADGPVPEAAAAGSLALAVEAAAGRQPAVVQRLVASEPALTTSTATILPAAPAGTFDLRPAGPPSISRSAGRSLPAVQPTAIQPSPAALRPAAQELPARRPTLGQARRLGLGVPFQSTGEPAIQRSASPGAPLISGIDQAVPTSGPAMTGGRLPAARPAGAEVGQSVGAIREQPGPLAAEPADLRPPNRPAELTVVRPISIQRVSSSALLSATPGQLAAARALGASDGPVVGVGPGLTASTTRLEPASRERGSSEPVEAAATSLGERRDVALGPPVARDSALSGLPILASSAGSLLQASASPEPHRRAATQLDRAVPASAPVVARSVADVALVLGGAVRPDAAGAASFDRVRRPEQPGPIVMRSTASARSATGEIASPPAAAPPVPAAALQRVVEVNEVNIPSTATDPASGAGPSGGPADAQAGQSGAGAGASPVDRDRELDDLARRLYGRIRSRLSAELLADRERSGRITDLR